MLDHPRLRPWLEPLVEAGAGAVLYSETQSFSLGGPLAAALIPLLTGELSADQIADRLSGHDQATVYFYIIKLEKLGLIEDGRAAASPPSQSLLAQLGGDPAQVAQPSALNLAALGGLDPVSALERLGRQEAFTVSLADWRASRAGQGGLWLALTPDYLEPELAEFHRQARARGWRWLPCKPLGVEPCFGPLFGPGESACLECLLHRLRGHRFERTRALGQDGRDLRLARGHAPAALDALWGLVGLELQKELARAPEAFLSRGVVSLDLRSLGLARHLLTRRPQCPVCGDTVAWGRMPVEPPPLRSRPKSTHRDGGERIWSADQTLALLTPGISPLTGEVGRMEEAETEANGPPGPVVFTSWAVLGEAAKEPPPFAGWRKGRAKPVGVSAGKGRTWAQARASALGEALERYCSQRFGYEPALTAVWAEVADRAIHPRALNAFSDAQYRDRQEWIRRCWTSYVPEPFAEQTAIDWTPAWSLSENRWKLLPAAHIYYCYPPERGGRIAKGDSNGVAAGNCLEEAFMQGVFELIERDAVALWWYNRLRRRAVSLESFGDDHPLQARAHLARQGFSLHALDLTSDLGTPVLAAVALPEGDTAKPPLLGLGCHFDVRIALHRALGEVSQGVTTPDSDMPLDLARQLLGQHLSQLDFLRPRDDAPPRQASEYANIGGDDFLADMGLMVEMLARRGLETLMVDLSRPEVSLNVVRVIVPGLAHFWPRLGTERLYRVPVEQGWLPRAPREEELNPLPFYL